MTSGRHQLAQKIAVTSNEGKRPSDGSTLLFCVDTVERLQARGASAFQLDLTRPVGSKASAEVEQGQAEWNRKKSRRL